VVGMPRTSKAKRLQALESAIAELSARLDLLDATVADRAPFSEVERLNHAFALISDRAPASEIERLNHAYELISDRAPAGEIDRLNLAFAALSSLQDQIHELNRTTEELLSKSERTFQGLLSESDRLNALIETASEAMAEGREESQIVRSIADHLDSRFDVTYHRFENLYRGSRSEIKSRMTAYHDLVDLPKLRDIGPAVDLGAGRGEWVELLSELGFDAYGVDVNADMASVAAEQGLTIKVEDLLTHVRSLERDTVGIISMFHVAEHLDFDALIGVIRGAALALAVGGALIVETPNPTNLQVGAASFYLDPTHVKPLHPRLLEFLFSENGFNSVVVHYLNPGPQPSLKIPRALAEDPDAARLVELVNQSLLSPYDYAVIGYKA
jgi:SAM-dependent methyltransferase